MMDKDFWINTGSYVGVAIGAFALACAKSILTTIKNRRRNSNDSMYIEKFHSVRAIDLSIHSLVTAVRLNQHATRASLLRFHNGDYYIDGSPIQKITCTHESVKLGIAHMAMEGVPLSGISIALDVLMRKDSHPHNIKEMPDCRFRRLLESLGTHVVAGVPVYISSHQLAGFLVLGWVDPLQRPWDKMQEVLEQSAREIGNEIIKAQAASGT